MSRNKSNPSVVGRTIKNVVGALPQQPPTLEQLIGSNLIKGDINPLRGIKGMTQDYNAAFTGFGPQGEQVPNFARALTLALPGGGGGPVGAAASGTGKGFGKKIVESFMRLIDEDIAAKTGNATAALRKAATASAKPEQIVGFKQFVKPKDVLSSTERTSAFVIDNTGKIIQVTAHSPEAHKDLVRISGFIGGHAGITLPPNPTQAMIRSIQQMRIKNSLGKVVINDSFGKKVNLKDLGKFIK